VKFSSENLSDFDVYVGGVLPKEQLLQLLRGYQGLHSKHSLTHSHQKKRTNE